MMLVTDKGMSETDLLRADEMHIRVVNRDLEALSDNQAGEELL